ncbi:MAG: hypothetical protein BGO70_03760 [Bacteroidetes bacterium 43-93]|nr:hypothetical protein [Bacteroidota bacterium]OJW98853.1 MAG: hypothetical protein BGO70_03760 [Bacteroidetes bacterium 43-93]
MIATLILGLVFLPVIAWYLVGIPLSRIGMKYGRNTLLFGLVLLGLRALDTGFKEPAISIALCTLAIVACADLLYAIFMQWQQIAGVMEKIYNLLAAYIPVISFLLFVPVSILLDTYQYPDRPFIALMYAANLASAVHNSRNRKEDTAAAPLLVLLSLVVMGIAVLLEAFQDFTLPL